MPSLLWLAISPAVSPQFWREMCYAYAQKFREAGDLHAAAVLYLAVHRAPEAVGAFRDAGRYADAVQVAKSLSAECPTEALDVQVCAFPINKDRGLHTSSHHVALLQCNTPQSPPPITSLFKGLFPQEKVTKS